MYTKQKLESISLHGKFFSDWDSIDCILNTRESLRRQIDIIDLNIYESCRYLNEFSGLLKKTIK